MAERIILHLKEGSNGVLALRSATDLIKHGHQQCGYCYEGDIYIFVRRNKSSVVAREA